MNELGKEGFIVWSACGGAVLIGCLALAACPPSPISPQPDADAFAPPVPGVDAASETTPLPPESDANPQPQTLAQKACAAMADAGCVEGRASNCAERLQAAVNARMTQNLTEASEVCVSNAGTVAAVKACGVSCTSTCPKGC